MWYGSQYGPCWNHAYNTNQTMQPDVNPGADPFRSASSSTLALSSFEGARSNVPSRGAAEHSSQGRGISSETAIVPARTEQSHVPRGLPDQSSHAERVEILANVTSALTMQCPACRITLCEAKDLAFFRRYNKQGGLEVHLMLKPERDVPETFKKDAVPQKGAIQSWSCACGTKLGDTRAVAVNKAPMTAFKSSSVILCNQQLAGKKSKWPAVYNTAPFDSIELRHRDTFFGLTH